MQNNDFKRVRMRKKKLKIKYKNVAIALVIFILLLISVVSCTSLFVGKMTKKDKDISDKDTSDKDISVNTTLSQETSQDQNQISEQQTESSTTSQTVTPEQVLQNAVFIGDSRMKGLVLYNALTNIRDYSYVGLNVETAITKSFITTSDGQTQTIQQALQSTGSAERIYISFGINELGWPTVDGFIAKYKEFINIVKQAQPNAKIYVLAILPVTAEKSNTDQVFNNTKISQYNAKIQQMTQDLSVTYLDCKSAVVDETGALPADSSTDGIHLTKSYCEKWLQYIKDNP